MKEIAEGTIGIVWMKNYPVPEISVHEYKKRGQSFLSWGSDSVVYIKGGRGGQVYDRVVPVLALMQDPNLGAEAFYFTPEEYKALVEGV